MRGPSYAGSGTRVRASAVDLLPRRGGFLLTHRPLPQAGVHPEVAERHGTLSRWGPGQRPTRGPSAELVRAGCGLRSQRRCWWCAEQAALSYLT